MFAAIGRFIKKVGKIFTAIPKVGYGLGEIVYGVGKTATQAPVGIYLTWVNIVIFIQTLWVFALTNFMCAMRMMNNASYCIIFYILDIIGQTLYLFVRLLIVILTMMGLPAKQWETGIWEFLEEVDKFFIDTIGIHIIHFSKSIRDTCYTCRRLKPTAFISKVQNTVKEIRNPIIPLLTGGISSMVKGLTRIKDAISF